MNNRNTTTRYHVRKAAIATAALVAAFGGNANAQTIFWTGADGANWNSTSWSTTNSNPGNPTTPTNGATLAFRDTFPVPTLGTKTNSNDFEGLSVAGLDLSNSGVTGYVLNGSKLTLTGNINGASSNGSNTINLPLEINAGSFGMVGATGSGLLTINGVISETGGSRTMGLSGNTALLGSNSFSGQVTVGTISGAIPNVTINTLGNIGANQSLGTGSVVQFGVRTVSGTVIYTGAATATDRQWALGESRTNTDTFGGGAFINNGSGAVTWSGAQLNRTQGASVTRNFTLGGTNTGDNDWQSAIKNNSTSGTNGLAPVSVTKTGTGKWILGGANTYTGATSVQQGVLLVDGSTAAGSAVTVDLGAVFGGNGTVNGDLTLASGALFAFDPDDTLDLSGTLALDPLFGVASLRDTSGSPVNWASVAQGTYTLMNTSFTFNTGNISNFGPLGQVSVAPGKSAYFQQGSAPSSLQLVVVPEPATLGLTALGMGLAGVACWRRRRG
jgi:fibronectin-binding autotransporter adhesin